MNIARTCTVLAMSVFVAGSASTNVGSLDGAVMIQLSADRLEFRAPYDATYHWMPGSVDWSAEITGTIAVDQTPETRFQSPVSGAGAVAGTLEGPTEAGGCYEAKLNVIADGSDSFIDTAGSWSAGPQCRPYIVDRCPTGCEEPPEECEYSPVLISFDGRYDLTGLDAPVSFDADGDGDDEIIGWTSADSGLGLLARDRNGNGVIDNGTELFGNYTPLSNGRPALNGFEALKELDDDGNGLVDGKDRVWKTLLVWTDRNHDGRTGPGELTPIANTTVREIGTDYHWSGRRDAHGNQFRYESLIRIGGGQTRPVYDVFFVGR